MDTDHDTQAERRAMRGAPASRELAGSLRLDRMDTPIGVALLVTDQGGVLRALNFHDYQERMLRDLRRYYGNRRLVDGAAPAGTVAALRRYFEGRIAALDEIEWGAGGTDFQRRVWKALTRIDPGTTATYGALANQLGAPRACRAVGLANGSNPIAIVVPCHRVIGANGTLTGYGGGLHRKRWLLEHEGVRAPL